MARITYDEDSRGIGEGTAFDEPRESAATCSWEPTPSGFLEVANETDEDVEVRMEEDRSIGPVRVEEGEAEGWSIERNMPPVDVDAAARVALATALVIPQPGTLTEAVKDKRGRNTRGSRGLANLPVDRETFDFFLGASALLRCPIEVVYGLVQEDIKRLLRGELSHIPGALTDAVSLPSLDERVTMEFARRVEERRKQRGGGK